jgi:hypothetical protein
MPDRTASSAKHVSPGCIVAISIPLVLIGLGMLGSFVDAVRSADFVRAYWNGVGALLSLGFPVASVVGRRRQVSAPVTAHTPFGCYAIMGGGLLLVGTGMLLSSLRGLLQDDSAAAAGYGIVAAALLGLGLWLVIGGRVATQRVAPLVDALHRGDPEPWRHVREWADGRARDAGNSRVVEAVVLAIVANAIVWPIAWAALANPAETPMRLVFLALPVAGALAALRAARAVRHRRLHGETIFKMDTFPGAVGQSLAGTVLIRIDPALARRVAFTVKLSSQRRMETTSRSSGGGVSIEPLWHAQQHIPAAAYRSELGAHLAFPISFAIPADAEPTTLTDPNDRVRWLLAIEGDVAGLPFQAEMEVPVFDLRDESERALEIPDLPSLSAQHDVLGSEPAPWTAADATPARDAAVAERDAASLWRRVFPARAARFVVDEEPGGRVHVQSETGDEARARAGFFLTVAGALALMMVIGNPVLQQANGVGLIPVAAMFGGSFLWLFYYRYTKSELTLSAYDVTLRKGRGAHNQVMLQYTELDRAEIAEVGGRSTTRNGTVVHRVVEHDVRIIDRNGQSRSAGLRVTDRKHAQWVAGHLNRRIAGSR